MEVRTGENSTVLYLLVLIDSSNVANKRSSEELCQSCRDKFPGDQCRVCWSGGRGGGGGTGEITCY